MKSKMNRPKSNIPNRILARSQAQTLTAFADRIFPPTDTPGAVAAGAVHYIEQALAGDYTPYLSRYRSGLRAVDRHARRKFGEKFAALSDGEKDVVLADFETGAVPDCIKAAEFFELARGHVLEGVFGEPEYGGNRGLIGWRLVGFPGQQFGYPSAYIDKSVDLSPVAVDPPTVEEE